MRGLSDLDLGGSKKLRPITMKLRPITKPPRFVEILGGNPVFATEYGMGEPGQITFFN